jgi:hypothetical protein
VRYHDAVKSSDRPNAGWNYKTDQADRADLPWLYNTREGR